MTLVDWNIPDRFCVFAGVAGVMFDVRFMKMSWWEIAGGGATPLALALAAAAAACLAALLARYTRR